MKKVVAWLVLLTMMVSAFASMAVAEETGEVEEILFRNIPWGSSETEVMEYLTNEFGSDRFEVHCRNRLDATKTFNGVRTEVPYTEVIINFKDGFEVAGCPSRADHNSYRQGDIRLVFAPVLSEDKQSFGRDKDRSFLTAANYCALFVENGQDFVAKMDSIYGSDIKENIGTSKYPKYVWRIGDTKVIVERTNDFAMLMFPEMKFGEEFQITNAYEGYEDELEVICNLINQQEAKEHDELMNNTDGL